MSEKAAELAHLIEVTGIQTDIQDANGSEVISAETSRQ